MIHISNYDLERIVHFLSSVGAKNYSIMTDGGYHKVPGYKNTSPLLFHPIIDIFPPKYNDFTHFEKESSSDSAKNEGSGLEMVPQ